MGRPPRELLGLLPHSEGLDTHEASGSATIRTLDGLNALRPNLAIGLPCGISIQLYDSESAGAKTARDVSGP